MIVAKMVRFVFCPIRAETERGLSRKHIIEGKNSNTQTQQHVDLQFTAVTIEGDKTFFNVYALMTKFCFVHS